jgi:arylsulfatase A-like enzyme
VAFDPNESEVESWAVVEDGWKLIKNGHRPEGHPEFELFDHRKDPLNLENVADDHPEVVARLAATLEAWHKEALASRVAVDAEEAEVSEDELEKLRALGYVN